MTESRSEQKTSRENVIGHALEILRVLGAPIVVESATLKLIELADKHDALASCNPVGGATGVLYIAGILTENPMTLAVVAEGAGVCSATVRKWATLLAEELRVKKN